MNKKLTDYPLIFADRNELVTHASLRFGVGWFGFIKHLQFNTDHNKTPQMKEKFRGLGFYVKSSSHRVRKQYGTAVGAETRKTKSRNLFTPERLACRGESIETT
jgi:hypothetical protein